MIFFWKLIEFFFESLSLRWFWKEWILLVWIGIGRYTNLLEMIDFWQLFWIDGFLNFEENWLVLKKLWDKGVQPAVQTNVGIYEIFDYLILFRRFFKKIALKNYDFFIFLFSIPEILTVGFELIFWSAWWSEKFSNWQNWMHISATLLCKNFRKIEPPRASEYDLEPDCQDLWNRQ